MFQRSKSASYQSLPQDNTKGMLEVPSGCHIKRYTNPFATLHSFAKESLFPHPPSFNDIKANAFTRHFYFLADIQSIINLPQGEEIIRGMMREEGKQVIVRVFKDTQVHYISIEKSVPVKSSILSPSALWVKMLEKAYALVYKGNYSFFQHGVMMCDPPIQFLTGASALKHYSRPFQTRFKLREVQFTDGPDIPNIFLFHDLMFSNQLPPVLRRAVCLKIFSNNSRLFSEWNQWLSTQGNNWQTLINERHPVCIDDFLEFFNSVHAGEEPAVEHVKQWVEQNRILFGKPLSGTYSQEEIDIFESIKYGLREQCPISVKTKSSVEVYSAYCDYYSIIGLEEREQLKYLRIAKFNFLSNTYVSNDNNHSKNLALIELNDSYLFELNQFCHLFMCAVVYKPVTSVEIKNRVITAIENSERQIVSNRN